jgi:hypothetical protein
MPRPVTIFSTYNFSSADFNTVTNNYGLSESIHCNYINRLEVDDLETNDVLGFFFPEDLFPFLASTQADFLNGTGWTATQINVIVQIVEGISSGDTVIEADPTQFRIFDVTSQLVNHTLDSAISKESLLSSVFNISQSQYLAGSLYDLSYLNYPTNLPIDDNRLAFGEESFFFGNVATRIGARVFTTDISVPLPLNQYNSTTNPTWDGVSPVQITEVGIYDDNNELVAIGKLNFPIEKDSTKFRTIAFELDF